MLEPQHAAHQRVKSQISDEMVLEKELTRWIEEYRSVNLKHFSAPEMSDMRRHFKAIGELPWLIQMIKDEIAIIRLEGPRPNPWWGFVD